MVSICWIRQWKENKKIKWDTLFVVYDQQIKKNNKFSQETKSINFFSFSYNNQNEEIASFIVFHFPLTFLLLLQQIQDLNKTHRCWKGAVSSVGAFSVSEFKDGGMRSIIGTREYWHLPKVENFFKYRKTFLSSYEIFMPGKDQL